MTPAPNLRVALPAVLVVALLASSSCTRKETTAALRPGMAVGVVLAEEVAGIAGKNTKVAIISHDASWGPASPVEEAFTAALMKRGYSFFIAKAANPGNPMHSGDVGLQPADLAEALQNARDAGVIVSFAGPPLLSPGDAARIPSAHPPILIVATAALGDQPGFPGSLTRVERLLDARIIQLAIIDGGLGPDAPLPNNTDATHELFVRNYSILRQPQ